MSNQIKTLVVTKTEKDKDILRSIMDSELTEMATIENIGYVMNYKYNKVVFVNVNASDRAYFTVKMHSDKILTEDFIIDIIGE